MILGLVLGFVLYGGSGGGMILIIGFVVGSVLEWIMRKRGNAPQLTDEERRKNKKAWWIIVIVILVLLTIGILTNYVF